MTVFPLMLVSAVLVLLILGGTEVVLRLLHYPPPTPRKQALQGNPYLLWELTPGPRGPQGHEHINALGLRGPELAIPKPAGVKRLIALGDSSVYGDGVEDGQVFSVVAAQTLGSRVEAVNAGVHGYSSLQALNLLRLRALKAEPDLFVIGTLWSDNNFDNFVDKEILPLYAGAWTRWIEGGLKLLSRSYFFRLVERGMNGRTQGTPKKVGWGTVAQDTRLGQRRVEVNDYAANLERLVKLAEQRKAGVVFLLLANEEDLANYKRPWAWDLYRQVMRDVARQHGYPVIDVPALFRQTGQPSGGLFVDRMHPNAYGHRVMGEALAALLREKGWAEGRSLKEKPEPGSTLHYPLHYRDPFATAPGPYSAVLPSADPLLAPWAGPTFPSIAGLVQSRRRGLEVVLEAVRADPPNDTIDQVRLPGGAPFALMAGDARRVWLRVSEVGDPRDPGTLRNSRELKDTVIDLSAHPAWGVQLDVDAGTLALHPPGPTTQTGAP